MFSDDSQNNPRSSSDLLDGNLIDPKQIRKDLINGKVVFKGAGIHNLVDLRGKIEDHLLTLQFKTPGAQVFAFTLILNLL